MRQFNEWLSWVRGRAHLYKAIERSLLNDPKAVPLVANREDWFSPAVVDFYCKKTPTGIFSNQWRFFMEEMFGSIQHYYACGVIEQLVKGGVKTFIPTPQECQAFANTALNVAWNDYRQPFDTFCVVLPEGMKVDLSEELTNVHTCIVRLGRRRTCDVLKIGDRGVFTVAHYAWNDDIKTIEDGIAEYDADPTLHSTLDRFVGNDLVRLALNACLMLTTFEAQRVGYSNPDHAAKLAASLQKKKLPDAIRQANELTLRLVPDVYSFAQSVTLFDRDDSPRDQKEPGDPANYELSPHWRRGHWARVACGAGHSERRLVFRRPTLVNAHKFYGDLFDTRTTYAAPSKPEGGTA